MEAFLFKWQTLIGSALGPFLAVVLSAIGFWIKSIISNKKELKEYLRRIEISTTRSLDDTYKARQKLLFFVANLRRLATEIRGITEPNHFSLETTNYPSMRDVYRDIDAPNFKIKSYYLHNKLLWIDAGIKETNETISAFRHDYSELQRKNELLVALIRQNQNPDPQYQRTEYATNLEGFANAVEEFVNKFMIQGIEFMTQVKIYNDKIRRHHGFWFLWKQEGTKLKYFRTKADQRAFARNLNSLDRIDEIIQEDVNKAINDAEERSEELARDRE
jgi:hypothetical protein